MGEYPEQFWQFGINGFGDFAKGGNFICILAFLVAPQGQNIQFLRVSKFFFTHISNTKYLIPSPVPKQHVSSPMVWRSQFLVL